MTTLTGLVVLLAVLGCAVSGGAPVPSPGADTRATAARADCDLTGVTISSPGKGGAVVPPPGRGVSNSDGLSLSTAPKGHVSVSVTG